jgi:hypothetical protein
MPPDEEEVVPLLSPDSLIPLIALYYWMELGFFGLLGYDRVLLDGWCMVYYVLDFNFC